MIARVFSAGRGSVLAVLLTGAVACTCGGGGAGPANGPSPGGAIDPRCEKARATIEGLYRAEAAAGSLSPERTEEMVKDNTAMVMNECALRPEMVNCASSARTSLQLEAGCLKPLDDEGSEGTSIRR
jgi:hypothetical protein